MKNTLKIIVIFFTSIFLLTSCSDNKQKFVYPLWEGAKWVDDYYIVGQLDEQTYAISEPTAEWYYNTSYLILGKNKALLFDTGYGSAFNKDIMPVVKKLTDLPVITMFSHFHLDHIANIEKQDNVWIIDLPYLRERAKDNKLTLTTNETLLFDPPTVTVSKWIKPNEIIDLGDRKVQVLNMTGHTTESTVLFDEKYKQLFTGDLFYDPRLDYVDLHDDTKADLLVNSTEKLVEEYDDNYVFNGAHGFPKQSYTTLKKYLDFLKAYKNKSLNSGIIATSIGFQTIYEKDGMRMATPTYGGSITHQLIINVVFGLLIFILVVVFIRKRMKK
ncbi:MBL fold metallo-hydrolase [Pasteurella skyensis]|uniref:MBL fold metallo-hydrolase n=1 Tax=Phocoenobacter skyensis TaxID=97481 RepID=A0AAJ6N8Q9_9PAST|nr:MBL fold metallo-hydrolase [Pasteurella skyensis]MDP8162378.1 MBL fold metallo-hydrolase [Pasteurella skyensis]MDP8172288.1 MBL fold metallo-hydrolase [Pasteurella skyensis]MDP8178543.1 MBL fold metallo-hydrolase [Pasteurella skyensis]MDP8182545.1 MBL fold metallo-hydrolase [Pasteurella skyensis]MDP8188850.1 MBL fold metallo-hydrolase [Pasteurella skyensis]